MNLKALLIGALHEDMPNGDATTDNLGIGPRPGIARVVAKQDLVLSGSMVFEQAMLALEPEAKVQFHFEDGQSVIKGQIVCTIHGDLVAILKAERVALNFLMRLSGIATMTSAFVKAVAGTSTKILDTRKTTPGLRELEKRAVTHGGGTNHRMSLSDAILIKDNHIAMMGGITPAVLRIRERSNLPIEVETKTLEEVHEAAGLKVHRILLDNMDLLTLQHAVGLIPDEIEIEASGNMTLARVRDVALTGVDFISVGALTHSVTASDLSLLFDWGKK